MRPLQRKARRFLGASAAIALGTTALIVISSGPAAASGPGCSGATIEVTANTDAALRAAFATASGLAGPQTICIDSGLGTVTLSGGELVYNAITTAALTLQGNGIIVNGNDASRVMYVHGSLTLDNVTVTGGHASGGFGAGGVFVNGNATLTNSTISDNTSTNPDASAGMFVNGGLTLTGSTISGNTETAAFSQGGVFANGNVSLTDSTISGNSAANDGGLYADGTVNLVDSTVSGNTGTAAGGGAGAIHATGPLTAVRSTISGNSAVDHGATVTNGDVTLVNSTVSGNTATGVAGSGGGMYVSGNVTLVYATVDGNHAAVGANVDASSALTSFGSVVAKGQGGGANCVVGSTTSHGYNSTDDASGAVSCHFAAGTDLVGIANDPMLAAVADNGGPTLTQLPLPLSPLVGAIPSASCETDGAIGITIDQRALPRPAEGGCDIGAVEVQAPPPTTTTTTTSSSSTTPPSTMPRAQAPTPVVATPKLTG